ncbi:Isy1-like splicing family-domain-containing protein [Tuber borchii]|uniref:Isy1-like splicing family-domain-containing protein n=1 Tax=Tuber borchii TaxID=42251 RepID=A0A2T6ZD35_TUBBO|nr:Isy1-like splicing family-domain-containing protein [Tuber borchii]
MDRNSEKTQSVLFRFGERQVPDLTIVNAERKRRPKMRTEVTAIPAGEKWCGQVVKDISRKVTKIQHPSLSDYQIRDLNCEIYKLMRDGLEVLGSRSNKYFGRARELPRIKELFDELKPSKRSAEGKDQERKLRVEMRRNVDADYYGFNRDEADRPKEVESFRNVERAGEEGAPEGWTPISGG